MTCAEVEEVRDLYVLGALTRDIAEDVEVHLADCGECREQVRAAWAVAQLIRVSVPQIEPSDTLRDRIIKAAAGEPTRLQPRERWRIGVWGGALAAALPLAAAVWLGWQMVALRQQIDANELALRQSWHEARAVAELLGRGIQSGSAMARVEGTDMAPSASGMFYYGPTATEGVLVVHGLPELPRDQVYQLWLVRGGNRMNGGTFVLEEGGKGLLLVRAPMPLGSLDWIGVSMEPSGGSAAPQGASYMRARIAST